MTIEATDSYADCQRYRVAIRQDGQFAVFDTERAKTVSVHRFRLDAVATAAECNAENDE